MKILITGLRTTDKMTLAKQLITMDDDLSIAPMFTSDNTYENIPLNDNYVYYMNTIDVNIAFKNNSLFYVNTDDYVSTGVTLDDYYNNDIVILSISDFNLISPKTLQNDDILIIWLDSKTHGNITETQLAEVRCFQEELDNYRYMYFLNDDIDDVCKIVLKYVNSHDEEEKNRILFENI